MSIIQKTISAIKTPDKKIKVDDKTKLLEFLANLKRLESRLWGITINELATGEEQVLEDTNHLIYMVSRGEYKSLASILRLKEVKGFFEDMKKLKKDFSMLRKQVHDQDMLKKLITAFTVKLVEHRNYKKMENIFILEKQLYEVLEMQENELENIIRQVKSLSFTSKETKVEAFIESLHKVRDVLAGHLDHHELWMDERQGFSNTSNIVAALIREISETQL